MDQLIIQNALNYMSIFLLQIHSIRTANKNSQVVLVRTANNELIKVEDNNWPNEILTTYNILQHNGKTIMVGIYPYSESGDWAREHLYYFDENGQTYCYQVKVSYFNSVCTDILRVFHRMYFNKAFKEIASELERVDKNGNDVDDKNCVPNNHDYTFQDFSNLDNLIQIEKITGW